MADATAAHAVLEVEDLKRKPEFPEETAMRMVAENAPSTTFVGEPLSLAMDPDDPQRGGPNVHPGIAITTAKTRRSSSSCRLRCDPTPTILTD